MSALVTIHNDGPDDLLVVFGDPRQYDPNSPAKVIKAGADLRVATSKTLSFAAIKPLTRREMLEAQGISQRDIDQHMPYSGPTRYADAE